MLQRTSCRLETRGGEEGEEKLRWQPARAALRSAAHAALLAVSGAAVLSAGCQCRDEASILSRTSESRAAVQGGIGLPAAAVDAIAQRRCDVAARCGRIGTGQQHARRVDCLIQARADWSGDLNRVACARGVHEARLSTCLREIDTQPCAALETGERPPACLGAAICDERPPAPAVLPPIRPVPEQGGLAPRAPDLP